MIKGLQPIRPVKGTIKGGKMIEKSGKTYPQSTPYFVVPEELKDVVGAEPARINIRLTEEPLKTAYKSFKGGTLYCVGDGETARRDGEQIKCDPENCPVYAAGQCNPEGALYFEVDGATGTYRFITRSITNIRLLMGGVEEVGTGNAATLTREERKSNGHRYYRVFLYPRATKPDTETEPATKPDTEQLVKPDTEKKAPEPTTKPDTEINSEKQIYDICKKLEIKTLDDVRKELTECFNVDYSDAGKYIIRNMPEDKRRRFLAFLQNKLESPFGN